MDADHFDKNHSYYDSCISAVIGASLWHVPDSWQNSSVNHALILGSRGQVLGPSPGRVIAVRQWHWPGSGLAWGSQSGSLLKGGGSGLIRVLPFSSGVVNA
jgi:hypothetical protein